MSNVTAILVVKKGGLPLANTLDALAEQTLKPDRLLIISLGESETVTNELKNREIANVIVTKSKASFGEALALGTSAVGQTEQASQTGQSKPLEWFWMLSEDATPEADTLENLMREITRTGSATVAGPKLVDFDDPNKIIELGQGLTWSGARWGLDNEELDQQQYDHLEDVLGVGPVGMLVRRDVWEHLKGFDPYLKHYDDGLDFSVRARLAGFRVIVVPEARIRYAKTGISGPNGSHYEARSAQLHRRLTYAKTPLLPILWLLLPITGIIGMFWALLRGRPATMLSEMLAALNVFFQPGKINRSRRNLKQAKNTSWSSLKPLRTDRKTVRSIKAIRKETILAELGRNKKDLHFISQGGLTLTIVMGAVAIGLTWWLLGAKFVTGGATGPLSPLTGLWQNTIGFYPESLRALFTPTGAVETIPADPINWLYAVFGSLTFWNPSFAVVLLLILAIPLAALGGWMWGARISDSTPARVLAGVLWGFGPMLLAAIATGRINAIILAVLLPWVLVTVANAHLSWSHAGTASLLTAAALAAAPSLLPAAIIILFIALLIKPTQIPRILFIAAAPIVLFAPLTIRAWFAGAPLEVLIDPGLPAPYTPATPWQMLLGFPTFGLDGWGDALQTLGVPEGALTLTVALLLTPVALLAVAGLFVGNARLVTLTAVAAALGLITGLLSPHLLLTPHLNELLPVWAGSGLALYWAAVATLAVVGTPALFKATTPVVVVALIGVLVVVSPSLWKLTTNNVEVVADEQQLPAVALAKAKTQAEIKTVFVTPLSGDSLHIETVTGIATTLDGQRTATTTRGITEAEKEVAQLIGHLAGGDEITDDLVQTEIYSIVMRPAQEAAGFGLHSKLQAAFDSRPELEAVGETSKGMLWRITESAGKTTTAQNQLPEPVNHKTVWGIQLALLATILLLALPTTEVKLKPKRKKKAKA